MASDINRIILVGRLTDKPEVIQTKSGSSICKFTLASNRSVKNGDTWTEEVGFFNCVMFGQRAKSIAQYGQKGMRVGIDGGLKHNTWKGQDGKSRSSIDISVESFQILDKKESNRGPLEGTGNTFGIIPSSQYNNDNKEIPF